MSDRTIMIVVVILFLPVVFLLKKFFDKHDGVMSEIESKASKKNNKKEK